MKKVLIGLLALLMLPTAVFAQQQDGVKVSFYGGWQAIYTDSDPGIIYPQTGFSNGLGQFNTLEIVAKYGNAKMVFGLHPFRNLNDSYKEWTPVGYAFANYALAENKSFEIGITTNIAQYAFGNILNGMELGGAGTVIKNNRPGIKYQQDNFIIGLFLGTTGAGSTTTAVEFDPSTNYFQVRAAAITGSTIKVTNTSMPRIEAGYMVKTGKYNGKVYGQIGYYDLDVTKNNVKSSNMVLTGILGLGGKFDLGNIGALNTNIFTALNMALTDADDTWLLGNMPTFKVDGDKLEVQNVISYGLALEYAYTGFKMVTPQIGGGFSMNDNSDAKISKFRYIVYANAPIKIYPRITLIPEISYINDTDEIAGVSTDKASIVSGLKLNFLVF